MELKRSLRAEMVSNFSLLLIWLTEIRTVLPYQEETLSLSTEYFPNDEIRVSYVTHGRNLHICALSPIIRKAAHAAATELQTFWPLIQNNQYVKL